MSKALRSQPQRRHPAAIAIAAVGEFVHAAAYRDYQEAVHQAVRVGAGRVAMARRLATIDTVSTSPSAGAR